MMLIAAFSHYFFGISIFLTSMFLILLVLVQRGRGGGLTGALGGPGGQSAFGTKAGDLFTRITVAVATVWIILCAAAVYFLGDRALPTTPVTRNTSSVGSGGDNEGAAPGTDPLPGDNTRLPGAGDSLPGAGANLPGGGANLPGAGTGIDLPPFALPQAEEGADAAPAPDGEEPANAPPQTPENTTTGNLDDVTAESEQNEAVDDAQNDTASAFDDPAPDADSVSPPAPEGNP